MPRERNTFLRTEMKITSLAFTFVVLSTLSVSAQAQTYTAVDLSGSEAG